MAKKVKTIIKVNAQGGQANPAPPLGPALGQHGVPIMDFVQAFNAQTQDQKGTLLPVVITVFEDRTFTFIVKKPPMAELIKMKLNLKSGSQKPGRDSAGKLSQKQAEEIAETKLPDLNTNDVKQAAKIVFGTARSMGIQTEDK